MKKVLVPNDIKQLVKRNILARLLYLLVCLVLALVAIYFYHKSTSNHGSVDYVVTVSVFLILPFIISGFPLKLIGPLTYSGKILKVDIYSQIYNADGKSSIMSIFSRRHKLVTELLIEEDTHHLNVTVAKNVHIKNHGYSELYKAGDRIVHVYGTDYIKIISDHPDTPTVCVVCGAINKVKTGKCCNCGYSLDVKVIDVNK